MAKCLTCGTVNPDENVYCAKCGTQLVGSTDTASAAAYEEAQKQFEKDALIGMNKDKIVYTCLLCGTVNRIENEVCSKCGKRRPRNEYVNALKKVQEGRAAQEEYAATQQAAAQAEAEAAAAQITPEEPQQEKKLALYRFVEEPKQLPQTVQPFVIVPYVNTEQPLWQYQPTQVYRFQPNTYEERMAAEHRAYAAQNGIPPTEEELLCIRSKVEAELRALDAANPAKVQYNNKKKKVRTCAAFSVLVSLAAIIMFFITALSSSLSELKGYGYIKALGACINGAAGSDLGLGASSYAYEGIISFVVPAGAVLVFLIAVLVLVFGIIRLITGRARVKGFVAPLIAFAIALAVAITMVSVSNFGFGDIGGFFAEVQTGFYALLGAPFILFVIGLACPKNHKLAA
ncbi:MAG: zinc ribbon domain-containing protein [Clostridia bacterium]|nr:zinc ribbon domain-containing protein [Clostridia bacterium]